MKKTLGCLLTLFAGLAAALGVYIAAVRPWFLRWGAGDPEVERPLPGDDIVKWPRVMSTRAISIAARPADIWPWLVQIGQGRGGLYSYDWLENMAGLEFHSAEEIVPDLQNLKVGDEIWLVPADSDMPLYFEVAILEPEKILVLKAPGDWVSALSSGMPYATWAFVLEGESEGPTRLIVRFRSDYRPDLPGILTNQVMLEPMHFIMEQKMMRSIKERAEGLAAERAASPATTAA